MTSRRMSASRFRSVAGVDHGGGTVALRRRAADDLRLSECVRFIDADTAKSSTIPAGPLTRGYTLLTTVRDGSHSVSINRAQQGSADRS